MSRLTSHKTRPGSRSVIFQSHARRPRCKRRMSAQCSSNSHQAIRALLRMQHPRQHRHSKSVPMTGCIQRSYSNTSLVQCHHHVAQQLLLFTVVTVVATGSTLASSPSRCHSHCLYRSLGRARCLPAGSFRVKGWATTPSCALSLSKTTVTAAWHTTHLASHACSCKFTLLPAVTRRTRDVSSIRHEHPPLASMRVILTDGSRAPPSAWTSPCVASLVQVTPDIQPHRSVALPLLPKTTWADELVLDTHVASMALHGCSSVASAALFFARRRQHWCLCPCVQVRDCAG